MDPVPDPRHRPVELFTEENYFFKLSEFTDPLLEWYEADPGAVTPESKRNEAIGLIQGGLQDISISRTSITWGVPVPWDPAHVFYVWYDALINYATAIGYGADRERFDGLVAGRPSPDRQGHPALPLRVLAGPAHGGRRSIRLPASPCTASCWWGARRCPSRRSTGSRPPI